MVFEWLAFRRISSLQPDIPLAGYLVALAYAVPVIVALVKNPPWAILGIRRWLLFAILIVITPVLARSFVVSADPGAALAGFSLAPLRWLPVLAAALWLGPGPAALVGLVSGLTTALFDTARVTEPLEIALMGALTSTLLNQRYRGMTSHWLRQPLIVALLGALVVAWPLGLLGVFSVNHTPALASLEYTATLILPTLFSHLGSAVISGAILQSVLASWPAVRPVREESLQTPPWDRQLLQRILYTFVPLAALASLILVGVVAGTSYRVATSLVIDQMARDAAMASSQVPFFIQVGRSLIRDLAQDDQLLRTEGEARQARLVQGLRAVPFFQQLLFFDRSQRLLAAYPSIDPSVATLAPSESSRVALAGEGGVPTEVVIYDRSTVSVSFVIAVSDPLGGAPAGVLVGRAALDANPILTPVVNVLREGLMGQGEGLIIDSQSRILLYPAQPELQQQVFSLDKMTPVSSAHEGQAFRQREADGTRRLVYLLPVAGRSDWSVVITVPNEVALALALQIALPTLLLLIVMAAVALPLIVALVHRLASPLEKLSRAADLITQGELDSPIDVRGEDEIGRLGQTFEQMRVRLKGRLSEQDRLLNVTRSVASNLELFRAMPPILSSALDMTQSIGVRVTLRLEDDKLQTFAAGEAASAMAILDGQLLDLVERQGTIVVSQLWRASGSLDTSNLLPRIRALVALPLRSETTFHGVMWLAYDGDHVFEESELTFLSTLSSQAAVAVANARLFAAAEEGRRKLEAVLESTADGIVVVDNQGKVVLINPAAKKYLDIRKEHVLGSKATEVIDVPELATLMTNLQEPVLALEMPQRDGKTFLANTSTIVGHDGVIAGRVAVLRDITPLKELDNIKTVFLRMVSHDLRSPLTYMRGYASMLPLAGDLNQRQQEALAKINAGIESISQMTERLTYLSRLQFGEEAELELTLVDVTELIQEVSQQQEELARQKNITLIKEYAENLPLLLSDGMLYGHAIMNLINNAIKYTPEGGQVTVRTYLEDGGHLVVAVADTGIGIRAEDQARLFEAFYRVPQREGEPQRPRGTGLGLALVKAIAQAHGGKVGVHSEFEKGSTFYISLPVRDLGELSS